MAHEGTLPLHGEVVNTRERVQARSGDRQFCRPGGPALSGAYGRAGVERIGARGQAGEDLGRTLRAARVKRVEAKRAHAGEESERCFDRLGVLIGQEPGGVAVGLELLPLAEDGELSVALEQRGAGVAVADVAVL